MSRDGDIGKVNPLTGFHPVGHMSPGPREVVIDGDADSIKVSASRGYTVEATFVDVDMRMLAMLTNQMFARPVRDLGPLFRCTCAENRNDPLCGHSQHAQARSARTEPIWAQLAWEMDLNWNSSAYDLFWQHNRLAMWPFVHGQSFIVGEIGDDAGRRGYAAGALWALSFVWLMTKGAQ